MRMTLPGLPPALLRLLQEQPDPAHAVGVAELAAASALEVGVDPTTAYLAGWLHDVGKLAVPQDLLNACRPLTSAERLMIQAHPVERESLVRRAWPDVSAEIVHAVRHHHERLDGQGYPDGRSSLPVLTMLVAAADVYDALTRDRCYHSAMGGAAAVEILRNAALSREVVEAVCCVSGTPGACSGGAAAHTGRTREIRVDAVAEQV